MDPKARRPAPVPPGGPRPATTLAWNAALLALSLLSAALLVWAWLRLEPQASGVHRLGYSEFKAHLARGEVKSAVIEEHDIVGTIAPRAEAGAPAPELFTFRSTRVEDPGLTAELIAAHVEFEGRAPSPLGPLLGWLLPIGFMLWFWVWLSRRGAGAGAAGPGALPFGRSPARSIVNRATGVTFEDVAGCDEAKSELREVIDFLRDPERYRALGAHIPKGVLLVGPPGTGKTLLARAVAGEAAVPFFSLSGSEFVEMFVGVGAARVRDLFEQAKRQTPCIVFIDELDAVGRQRGIQVLPGNDEREQTLNQLLVELDGFEANAGVVLLAATNRPETLDKALLRPGRFDRQVVLDAPDARGRTEILGVHTRGKPLAQDVDLEKVALATSGFSGADLANVVNEAALLAVRQGASRISQSMLEESVEKVVAGPERKSRRLSEADKRRVAFHEVGHALVAALCEHADPVHKISIVPRGRAALGYTLQLPTGDQLLLSRAELVDRLRGLLGGRAAEDLVFEGEVSTGSQNDLQQATALAREMVTRFGMGRSTGLMECAPEQPAYLPGIAGGKLACSDSTAREIDQEVREILEDAYREAREMLQRERATLERIAAELLRRETLDEAAFRALLGRPPRGGSLS
jgi:cell division protease FtsH